MTCKIDGEPYNAVLNVNINDTDISRKSAIKYIEYFKKLVSSGLIGAVIYIFPNDDVLQYCGGKDYFCLEYVKIFGTTPNIYRIKAYNQEFSTEEYAYTYCGETYSEKKSDLIPSKTLYEIIRYSIIADNTDYRRFLDELYKKFDLYPDYAFMSADGYCTISAR